MNALSDINWGPLDAGKYDEHFAKKFIEPEEVKQLLSDAFWIITGEKGSGKTALAKAYQEPGTSCFNQYSCVVNINYDDMEPGTFKSSLEHLSQQSGITALTLMTNYWEYMIMQEAIKGVREKQLVPDDNAFETIVRPFNTNRQDLRTKKTVGDSIVELIQKSWERYEKTSHSVDETKASLRKFPSKEEEFQDMLIDFGSLLRDSKIRVLVILDGFDKLLPKSELRDCIQLVFAGLIAATYNLYLKKELRGHFIVKALIPYDRFIAMELRDMDKIHELHCPIRWDYELLQELIARRISLSLNMPRHTFEYLWRLILPEEIYNARYELREYTFDYILRHTMWRPRHLQTHLFHLAKKFPNRMITSTMLRESVRESCSMLVDFFISEFKIEHPYLRDFLILFHERSNIMKFSEFYDLVLMSRLQHGDQNYTIDEHIAALFKIGFFGIIEWPGKEYRDPSKYRYAPPRKPMMRPYYCNFYYNSPLHFREPPKYTADTYVAIHPIFRDRCNQKPHENMLVG